MCARPPVVIVGSGVAGLATALAAAPVPVRLLCRSHDGGGTASALAQGGIAAALGVGDSPASHVDDTLEAGAHHNELAMVQWLCTQAPALSIGCGSWACHSIAMPVVACSWDGREVMAPRASYMPEAMQAAQHLFACCADGCRWRRISSGVVVWRSRRYCCVMEACAGYACVTRGAISTRWKRLRWFLQQAGWGRCLPAPATPGGGWQRIGTGARGRRPSRDLEFMQFHPTALDICRWSLPAFGHGGVARGWRMPA